MWPHPFPIWRETVHMASFDPRVRYKDFYGNDAIRSIADKRRWSISTAGKKPVDTSWLAAAIGGRLPSLPPEGVDPPGARLSDPSTMMTLDELTDLVPDATNFAFALEYTEDQIVILDVEPHAPADVKAKALRLKALYRERSLSGRGYHMVFPSPSDLFERYPAAARRVVKRKDGAYELHMRHWVTFTRDTEPHTGSLDTSPKAMYAPLPRPGDSDFDDSGDFRKFIAPLFRAQRAVTEGTAPDTVDAFLTDEQADLVERIVASGEAEYGKTLSDFDDDASRYEFGYMSHILNVVRSHVEPLDFDGRIVRRTVQASRGQCCIMAYMIGTQLVPHRKKHEQRRDGMPWLLYTATKVMERDGGGR